MGNELAKALYSLCWDNPFISNMVSCMARITDPKRVKQTGSFAAVVVSDSKIYLYINEDIFKLLTLSAQKWLLSHEMYHILYEHSFRCGSREHRLYNLAADLAINSTLQRRYKPLEFTKKDFVKVQHVLDSQIPVLPSQIENGKYRIGFLPKDFQFDEGLSAEEYYDLLIQKGFGGKGKKIKVKFSDGSEGEIDIRDLVQGDIENLEEMLKEGSNSEFVKEEMKRIVKQALDKAQSNGQGFMSAELQELINKMLTVKINWKALLRNFMQVATKFFLKRTTKRPNRRFSDFIMPSQINRPKIKILTVIDGSGSVSDAETAEFFGQLDMMITQGIEVDYTIGDAEITMKPQPYKKGVKVQKTYGGTDPNPWLKCIDKHSCDVGIVLTDGEFYNDMSRINKPVLFVITRKGSLNNVPKFYKKILMELKDKNLR